MFFATKKQITEMVPNRTHAETQTHKDTHRHTHTNTQTDTRTQTHTHKANTDCLPKNIKGGKNPSEQHNYLLVADVQRFSLWDC